MKNDLVKVFFGVTFFKTLIVFAQETKKVELQPAIVNDKTFETVLVADDSNLLGKEVESYVKFLASDTLEGRDTGSKGLADAAKYVEDVFKKNHVSPYFDSYQDIFDVSGIATQNVVGYLKGNDPELAKEFVILGAHYDHIGTAKKVGDDTIANGANDNAAGSAAVIALAKYFSEKQTNKRSMLFVLFGAEEKGLLGSKHLSKKLKEKGIDLYTMVNFEMIGVPLEGKSHKAYITGYETSNMAAKLNEYAGQELIGFLPKAKAINLFKRSDNYPFYQEFDVPCQTISTFDFTNYAYYHHVDDEASELDFSHMADLIHDCAVAIEGLVNAETKEIILNKE